MKKKNKVLKRILILLSVTIGFTISSYIGYCLYERYESNYQYRYCGQIWLDGYYEKNLKLKFNYFRMNFDTTYIDYKEHKCKPTKFKREDVSIKIDGQFYRVSDLTLEKLKEFNKFRAVTVNGVLNKQTQWYVSKSEDRKTNYGLIELEFENGMVKYITISAGGKHNKFLPEIKFKNLVLKMPTNLQRLEEVLPEIRYYSRTYITFDERLRRLFFKAKSFKK